MPSRKLSDLHPDMQPLAEQLIANCHAEGIELIVTATLRTFAEQDVLYAKGRTRPGAKITNARGGQSWHNFGLAIDVVPKNATGLPDWKSPHWGRIGEIGKSLGFKWGGDFKSIKDKPHFEYHPGVSLATANQRHRTGADVLHG